MVKLFQPTYDRSMAVVGTSLLSQAFKVQALGPIVESSRPWLTPPHLVLFMWLASPMPIGMGFSSIHKPRHGSLARHSNYTDPKNLLNGVGPLFYILLRSTYETPYLLSCFGYFGSFWQVLRNFWGSMLLERKLQGSRKTSFRTESRRLGLLQQLLLLRGFLSDRGHAEALKRRPNRQWLCIPPDSTPLYQALP